MLKKLMALLCLTLSIVLFCMAVSATEIESESESTETVDIDAIYVSGTVAEGGTGVIDAPVSTLSEAYTLLGNDGTIYLMDTVEVTATEGDCFIAPAHTGKITITNAEGYTGALDLTGVAHVHFGGETEWNNIGVIANDLVLTADNHVVTMGEGLTMSSSSDNIAFRGGHAYCGARIHLAAYTPCDTANITCEAAGGELYVYSGEYWSVSTWYGETITVSGGSAEIFIGRKNDNDSIWVLYLSPGTYHESGAVSLTAADSAITVITDSGLNTAVPYRFTKGIFYGSMTVTWIFRDSPQGEATALAPQDFVLADDAICRLLLYVHEKNAAAQAGAKLFAQDAFRTYISRSMEQYRHTCELYVQSDGRILCKYCEYEQCRHLTSVWEFHAEVNCTTQGEKQLRCTDLCGELFGEVVYIPIDPAIHIGHEIKSSYDPNKNRMGARCAGCNTLFSYIEGMPDTDVYVAQNVGTPISILNIQEHFADSAERIGTMEHPFANFADAMRYAMVAVKQHDSVTVHILDDAYVPSGYKMPESGGHITITGGTLHFDGISKKFKLNGNVTFEHITFQSDNSVGETFVIISAQNHKLVMGEGIVMGNETTVPTERVFPNCNSVKMFVIGGFKGAHNNEMNTDITIRSGDYWFVGGCNYNASLNNGVSKITIGKTDPEDKLQVFYLCPFSRGDGYISRPAEGTIIVDGDLYVKRFYVTTLNDATTDIEYIINVVLQGDITGYNVDNTEIPFDLRGCPSPFPITTVNIYTDSRVATAVDDSYVFFGHPDGTYDRDISLDRLDATVNEYAYTDYCADKLGGHADTDADLLCDTCGYVITQ